MKTVIPVLAILAAGTAFGQHRAGGVGIRPSGYGSVSGFGSVLYPGTGHPPISYSGRPFSGRGGYGVGRGSGSGHGYRSRGIVAAYPIFLGGYGYGYGYGMADPPMQSEQPPETVVVQQPAAQAAAPVITINQYFKSEGPRTSPGRHDDEFTAGRQTHYLPHRDERSHDHAGAGLLGFKGIP